MSDTIKKLTPYQHVRLRTSVYYGSTSEHTQNVLCFNNNKISVETYTWVPAVFTCLREIIDNALDEVVVKKNGNRININYDPNTLTFSVEDNGRGIPIDWDDDHRMHKVTLALSELMTGRNFENRDNTAGMNGIGASGVNYCSKYFDVTVYRDNKKFHQKFSEGSEVFDELQIHEPVIKSTTSNKTGTIISFKLSETVFPKILLPFDFVRSRVIELAYCNPEIQIYFNGSLIKTSNNISKSLFSNHESIPINISHGNDFISDFYLVTDLLKSGEYCHTLVNNIPAFDGGKHIDAFKRYFSTGLLSALERESNRRGLTPSKLDIYEGLLIFNITKMKKPDFDSQSKTRLINDDVDVYIRKTLEDGTIFKKIIKTNKEWIDQIYARCAARTQKKDDAEIAKLGRKLMRTKVPKLLDANGKDRTKCVLLITEGDCIQENTEINVIRDATVTSVPAKDIRIGDCVITANNNIKPIVHLAKKVTKCIEITTEFGKISVSPEHKLLVLDTVVQQFAWLQVKDIDPSIHKLVRNRYVDMSNMQLINSVNFTNDGMISIMFGDLTDTQITATPDHTFGVYNTNLLKFERVASKSLIPNVHALVMS